MALRITEEEYAKLRGAKVAVSHDDTAVSTPKRSKYNNKRVVVDGVHFDSGIESRRWFYLRELEKAGKISNLRRQVDIPVYINGVEVCFWRADHVYNEEEVEVWEDVKGKETELYLLKKKLVEATYRKQIKEVRKGKW